MSSRALLPRRAPSAAGVSSAAVNALLDRLDAKSVECHSIMVVHRGAVVAEGWWAPYSAERPHLLYSLTKSFTSMAVGLAISDGVLSLDDRVVDVLPEHVPSDLSEQARNVTVHHLLSMTTGHGVDTLAAAWQQEPDDLVRGFLRQPLVAPPGVQHVYDNATAFVLARMVERATGLGLPELLDERLFGPMGIDDVEWDRVGSGLAFGFHGLHLTTEAVAAFGELLRRGGRWGEDQLVAREWVERATRRHVDSAHYSEGADGADFLSGYGYQVWMSTHGFHGNGAFGQHCVVVPSHDLVVVLTSAQQEVQQAQDVLDGVWECLLPGIGVTATAREDARLAGRLRGAALPVVKDTGAGPAEVSVTIDASPDGSALPAGTEMAVDAVDDGWRVRLRSPSGAETDADTEIDIMVGRGAWRTSTPAGRPVSASGSWYAGRFVAEIYVVTSPHCVRLEVDPDAQTATAVWRTVPLTSTDLRLHLRSPLMTRPDVS